jgi:hypothetical protein
VLEKGAHAGLRHGFRNPRRRQLGRVVLHPEPLPDDVGLQGLEAVEPFEALLEQPHLAGAAQPFDLEDRFGVQLTDGAGRHRAASWSSGVAALENSSTCVIACLSSSRMW